jgi:hypothetical protein
MAFGFDDSMNFDRLFPGDKRGVPFIVPDLISSVHGTAGLTSTLLDIGQCKVISFSCDVDCWIWVADTGGSVSKTTGSRRKVYAKTEITLFMRLNQYLAVIADSATGACQATVIAQP